MSEYKDLGKRVKQLRSEKNMTLQKLSELTGLSTGSLSQFERGLATIAIDSLAKIAKVLKVSLSSFFAVSHIVADDKFKKYDLIKNHERTVTDISGSFVQYNLLRHLKEADFLPRYFELLPKNPAKSGESITYQHDGHEFIYVLEGIVTLIVEDERIYMYPGDSVYLASNTRHTWENETGLISRVLLVHSPNPYLGDTDATINNQHM